MPTRNINLTLLFLSLSLLSSFHFARPDASPSPSPLPDPDSSSSSPPAPSPSPVADGPANYVVSNALSPSPSPSPVANGPTTISNAPSPSPVADGPTNVFNAPSPSPIADGPTSQSPVADGPTNVFNAPSPSPVADGPAKASNAPSPSPEADGPTAASDGPSPSDDDGPTRRTGLPEEDLAEFDILGQTSGPSSAAGTNPKVKEICDTTDHPDLCLTTILPRLDGDSSIPAVVEIAIRRSTELAKIGWTMAKTMANNASIPKEQASILNDCRDSYDYAVYNFESALESLPGRDVDTMRSMLSAVITDVGDCEDRLSRYGDSSPFANVGDKLVNMTSNCLAIVSLLN